MNELIALQQTKADGRSTGAVRKQSRPMHAVRAPHPSRAHGFASIRPGVQRNERRPITAIRMPHPPQRGYSPADLLVIGVEIRAP